MGHDQASSLRQIFHQSKKTFTTSNRTLTVGYLGAATRWGTWKTVTNATCLTAVVIGGHAQRACPSQ
jgi:hypothetical protein